jgi:Ca-activated chloride channel family protein
MTSPVRLLMAVAVAGGIGYTQFRSDVRLVEVYASITDQKGRHVDGLERQRFHVADEGTQQKIVSFETEGSELTCAILLDTTGSMQDALPKVKNAVSSFLEEMREGDAAGIFAFNATLVTLQDFTTDRDAARRAVLRTRAAGATALFDALASVARSTSARRGKKAIVLFTDGDDNASGLTADGATKRILEAGVPVYTVLEGEARRSPVLRKRLRAIAESTGGFSSEADSAKDIEKVFMNIEGDLKHLYLLTYSPPATADVTKWRAIRVEVEGLTDYKVRGKQGYFPE